MTARFAAYTHVWLRIEISADPVAEQRLLVQYEDSLLLPERSPESLMCIASNEKLVVLFRTEVLVLIRGQRLRQLQQRGLHGFSQSPLRWGYLFMFQLLRRYWGKAERKAG